MVRKRLIIEMGMGIDQHGQEPTVAAARAVRNAIAHNALPGVWEVAGLSDPNEMIVEVQVVVPYPEQVQEQEVLAVLPFGRKSLTVESGGMVVQGRAIPSLNDKNDEMLIAIAAVTVLIEIGLTQLAYFFCRVCDAGKIFERSNETCSVTHQPPIVTLA